MSRISNEMLLDLYGCAGQPQRWRQLLDGMCSQLNVRSAVAQIFQRDGFKLRQRWAARDTYSVIHASQHDAWVNNDQNPRTDLRIAMRLRNDVIFRDQDVFEANCPHLTGLKTRLSAIGLGESISIGFSTPGEAYFSLVLHRASDDNVLFGQNDEELLRDLVPHLQQMLKLSAARDESLFRLSACEEAINSLHTGVIVCDLDRNVTWLNEAAEQTIQSSPYLSTANGALQCASAIDEKKLRNLIAGSSQAGHSPSARAVVTLGGAEDDAVQIATFPVLARMHVPGSCFGTRERVGLLLTDRRRPPSISACEVAQLFNLSPAEASLAAALCAGRSVSDYASLRGISVGTARIQLKSILSKTNSRRQADLVRQICASVIVQTGAASR